MLYPKVIPLIGSIIGEEINKATDKLDFRRLTCTIKNIYGLLGKMF